MRALTNKQRIVAGFAGLGLVVATGGAAFAFFSANGSGRGTAGTGTSASVTLSGATTASALSPGSAPVRLNGKLVNPNPFPVIVTKVVLSPAAPTPAAVPVPGDPDHECSAGDYEGGEYSVSVPLAANDGVPDAGADEGNLPANVLVSMIARPYNQDNCQGATANFDAILTAVTS